MFRSVVWSPWNHTIRLKKLRQLPFCFLCQNQDKVGDRFKTVPVIGMDQDRSLPRLRLHASHTQEAVPVPYKHHDRPVPNVA